MKLLAFNNDPQLKADLLVELKKHRKADEIIKGTYGNNSDTYFQGCAVGCSINSYNKIKGLDLDTSEHLNYEKFGIPQLLARLEDSIFESLPSTHNIDWPINFMAAINVGADLSTIWPKFAQWLMTDKKHGVLQYAKTDAQKDIIQKISDLYKNGGNQKEFRLAAHNAYYASGAASFSAGNAADAAGHAAASDASDAAGAAAGAAASFSAANAADVASSHFDYSSDDKCFEVRIAQSEYLIKLLKECK